MGRWLALLVMFLPSSLKTLLLRWMGHPVHPSAYIGFSYLNVRKLNLARNTYIGHGNLFTRVNSLIMHEGSRINRWNHCTSGGEYPGYLELGANSAITLRHYLDLSGGIRIGANCIIAGHRSTFFTHSKGVSTAGTYLGEIIFGDWCYIGSGVSAPPGVIVSDHCFVGMGSVLVGDYSMSSYSLIAGNPAKHRKSLPRNAAYFERDQMAQPHVLSKMIK